MSAALVDSAARVSLEERRAAPPRPTSGPDLAIQARVRRWGPCWEVEFRGRRAVLGDLKGLGYLARLLAEPGREIAALDLVAAGVVERGLPVLDDEAKRSYRRRLSEVEEDIAEAVSNHDEGRRAHAEREREHLVAELSRAVGLGGRPRTTGGTGERARCAVTRSLRYALARLSEQHPDLGAHLAGAVRTGATCSYRPDPLAQVEWRFG
jgi:hypothetical protein